MSPVKSSLDTDNYRILLTGSQQPEYHKTNLSYRTFFVLEFLSFSYLKLEIVSSPSDPPSTTRILQLPHQKLPQRRAVLDLF